MSPNLLTISNCLKSNKTRTNQQKFSLKVKKKILKKYFLKSQSIKKNFLFLIPRSFLHAKFEIYRFFPDIVTLYTGKRVLLLINKGRSINETKKSIFLFLKKEDIFLKLFKTFFFFCKQHFLKLLLK